MTAQNPSRIAGIRQAGSGRGSAAQLIWLAAFLALGCTTLISPAAVWAAPKIQTNENFASVSIGFDGKIVLGRWVPVAITTPQPLSEGTSLSIETLDGDAVPVRYSIPASSGSTTHHGLARFGRATGVTIRVHEGDKTVSEIRLALEDLQANHSFLPGTTRLLLMLGAEKAEDVESLVVKREQIDETVVVQKLDELPTDAVGYDSVRMAIVVPLDKELPSKLTTEQAQAFATWVSRGGNTIFTGGPAANEYFGTGGTFAELTPGTLGKSEETRDSGAIELLTKSNDPLVRPSTAPLTVIAIEPRRQSSVAARVADFPLLVRDAFGFGIVTFCSVDFTSEPLSDWSGRTELLANAVSSRDVIDDVGIKVSSGGRVSHIGYEDMAGQLRASLDQFRGVSFITFTSVALLVGLFILLIGPGDYFFLRKFTKGRMQLTWLTFSLLALAFCALAWYIANNSKSKQIELNQVEVIDIAANDGTVRGSVWAHLYSPTTNDYTIGFAAQNEFTGEIDNPRFSWQGLPGGGLGSMQSRSELGLYRKPYSNDLALTDIPLQNASTKTMFGRWTGKIDSAESAIRSNLRQSPTSDALLGSFTNPLDAKLYDCLLLYGDWVYVLEDRPLDAGDTLLVEDDMRETTVKGHYTRTTSRGGDKENAAWSTSNTRASDILQMMGFFEAIGGQTYTRLTNDFHPELDLSEQLEMGNAILVGQVPQVTTPLNVNGETFDRYDKKLTLVRVVFPVKSRQSKK